MGEQRFQRTMMVPVAIILVFWCALQGQTSLSLDQAVRMAIENNDRVHQYQERVRQKAYRKRVHTAISFRQSHCQVILTILINH
jgi:hypothetical protein